MLHRIARVLMNEADASPGGGAASTPTTPNAQAQEPAAPASPAITLEAIAELLEKQKNSVEANTRRMIEGALGKKKGAPPPVEKDAAPEAAPAQPQPDMRAFDRAVRRLDLSDSALARMERAYVAETPDDAAEWVRAYTADLGIKTQTASTAATPSASATAPATPAAPATHATPAPSTTVPSEGPDQTRKWDEHQLRAYIGKNGGDASNLMSWRNRKVSIDIAQKLANELVSHRVTSSKGGK